MHLRREIGFGPVKAYEYGEKPGQPVVVYVHGGPGSHSHYFASALKEIPELAEGSLTWLLYDQRGCGCSESGDELSHKANIRDLAKLLSWADTEYGSNFVGVVGHSYGAWLAYDTLTRLNYLGPKKPLIMVGLNPNRGLPRQRNLTIELILAKLNAPEEYDLFLNSQPALVGEESWRSKDALRQVPFNRDLRGLFYWANLQSKAWYEDLKKRCLYQENDQIFVKVRDSIYEEVVDPIDFSLLPKGSTLLLGYQDFMMGGELLETNHPLIHFFKSGHYPQYEQPTDFLAVIKNRFGVSCG